MAKASKRTCTMCGTKIKPEKLVVHKGDNYCSQGCIDWHIQVFEDDEEIKHE